MTTKKKSKNIHYINRIFYKNFQNGLVNKIEKIILFEGFRNKQRVFNC